MFEFIVSNVKSITLLLSHELPEYNSKYGELNGSRIVAGLYCDVSRSYETIKRLLKAGKLTQEEPKHTAYKRQLEPELWFYVEYLK